MAVDVEISPTDVAIVLAVGVAAWLAWRGYKAAGDALERAGTAVSDAVDGAVASVQQAWNNTFSGELPERTQAWYLYSDEAYTGIDPHTGQSAIDGARASEEFRRYEAEFRAAEEAANRARSTTTTEGAAFGIYPSAGRRTVQPEGTW